MQGKGKGASHHLNDASLVVWRRLFCIAAALNTRVSEEVVWGDVREREEGSGVQEEGEEEEVGLAHACLRKKVRYI